MEKKITHTPKLIKDVCTISLIFNMIVLRTPSKIVLNNYL